MVNNPPPVSVDPQERASVSATSIGVAIQQSLTGSLACVEPSNNDVALGQCGVRAVLSSTAAR